MTCSSIKKKFYEIKLGGKRELRINIKDVKERDIEDLKECGYYVKQIDNQLIIRE